MNKTTIDFYLGSETPQNIDPYNYDLMAHHLVFTSTFLSLVNLYKKGEITPVIAKSWKSHLNFTEWHFELNTHYTFKNGKTISPEIVKSSLTRIAYLQKKNLSSSGLLENLKEISSLTEPTSNIDGIQIQENTLILKFNKPVKKLLEKISFGLYAIVDPEDWDQATGEWLDKKSANTSGNYYIEKWTDSNLILKRRTDAVNYAKINSPLHEVIFTFDMDGTTKRESQSEIAYGSSVAQIDTKKFSFLGPKGSNIFYYVPYIFMGNNGKSIEKNCRIKLRSLFYNFIEEKGFKITRSFFPLNISGTKEFTDNQDQKKDCDLTFLKDFRAIKFSENENKSVPLTSAINEFYTYLEKENNVKFIEKKWSDIDWSKNPGPNEFLKHYDFHLHGTGILVQDPYDDIKFMFESKEGIQLPDENNEIKSYLSDKDKFDIQLVNKLLWEQGLVWPIDHFSFGIWINNDEISVKSINPLLPATDLNFFELK